MKLHYFLIALTCALLRLDASEPREIARSPSRRFGVVERGKIAMFWDYKTQKVIGHIFTPSHKGELNAVEVLPSWSQRETNLILIVSKGTRLREIVTFSMDQNGIYKMKMIEGQPDPVKIMGIHLEKKQSGEEAYTTTTFSDFRIKNWPAENVARVVETLTVENPDANSVYEIEYSVVIEEKKAKVRDARKAGTMSSGTR